MTCVVAGRGAVRLEHEVRLRDVPWDRAAENLEAGEVGDELPRLDGVRRLGIEYAAGGEHGVQCPSAQAGRGGVLDHGEQGAAGAVEPALGPHSVRERRGVELG